jgi:hypothetical protein
MTGLRSPPDHPSISHQPALGSPRAGFFCPRLSVLAGVAVGKSGGKHGIKSKLRKIAISYRPHRDAASAEAWGV